jgi:hypothetical protein
MTNNGVDINEVTKQEYITPVSIYDGKYTKTTQFMLPSVGVNVKNRLIFKFFLNAYLQDMGHRHQYERPIFVLFNVKNFGDRDWEKVYSALVKSPNYINDYDIGKQEGNSLVMLVFKVPDEFERDYYYFKRGKYSKFSEVYKEKFPKISQDVDGNQKESILWQVVNKDPALKREIEEEFGMDEGELDKPTDGVFADEIWDIPRKNREYYRYVQDIP